MSRYGNVKAGAYNKLNVDSESSDTSEKLNDVERVLNKMGISIRKTNLEFKDFDDVLDEIADKWGTLDNVTKRAMANAFAGVRQNEAFLVLMENYDKYQELLQVSENSKGTAEKKYQSYRESYAFARNELTAALEQLANSSEVSKLLTDITKVETGLLKVLQEIFPYLPGIFGGIMQILSLFGKGTISSGYRMMQNIRQSGIGAVGRVPNGSGGAGQKIPMTKMQAGMAVADFALSTIATAITQYATAATTHKDSSGKSVESSAAAQKQGAAVSSVLSLIPVVGGLIGPYVGEQIAKEIDKNRDRANLTTERANTRLNKLAAINSSLTNIGTTEVNSAERHKLVEAFKEEIFAEENKELRQQLTAQLGTQNLSNLLSDIDGNTLALREVQKAQYELQKQEIAAKYSATMYTDQQEISELYSKIDNYSGVENGTVGGALGITALGGAGGALSGLAAGAAIGAAFGGAGAIPGAIIGLIAGLVGGGIGGGIWASNDAKNNRLQHSLNAIDSWNSMNDLERYDEVTRSISTLYNELSIKESVLDELTQTDEYKNMIKESSAGTNNILGPWWILNNELRGMFGKYSSLNNDIKELSEALATYQSLADKLEQQISIQSQIKAELNEVTLQQALTVAELKDANGEGTGKYLDQMSISELKALGIDEILKIYGQAIDASGGLRDMNIWDKNGELSDVGYNYLYTQLRKQGDEEINAVLSGSTYSLQEALNLQARYPGSKSVQRILESFSSAIGVSVDQLQEVTDQFGMLTVSDLVSSTTDINSKIVGFADLLNSIANGAGDISTWMETIISQYPALIQYMGDTSQLFTQSIKNMKQLAYAGVNAQGDEVLSSADFFSKYLTLDEYGNDSFYDKLSDDAAAALRQASPNSFLGVLEWITSQYHKNAETDKWELTEDAKEVAQLMSDIFKESGIQLMDSSMKSYYELLINYQTQTLDKEINNLNEQKEALKEINSQREYENKLVEARLKLEDAAKQKKRVYRAGIGWVYEADQSAVASAQKELDSVEREKQIAVLDDQIAIKQKQKDELSQIFEKENYETLEKLYEAAVAEGDTSKNIDSSISMISDSIDGIKKSLEDYLNDEQEDERTKKENAMQAVTKAWNELQNTTPGTGAYNTALQAYHLAYDNAIAAHATEEDFSGLSGMSQEGRNILQGATAWDVGKQSYADQQMWYRQDFSIQTPGQDGYYSGYTNGNILGESDPTVSSLLHDVEDGSAWIYTKNGKYYKTGNSTNTKRKDGETFQDYLKRVSGVIGESVFVVADPEGNGEAIYYDGSAIYAITNDSGDSKNVYGFGYYTDGNFTSQFAREHSTSSSYSGYIPGMPSLAYQQYLASQQGYASGSLGINAAGVNLINELGTEAIITPQGTITALPSKTGIVPADITKNLWALGGIAPALLQFLSGKVTPDHIGKSVFDGFGSDDSLNIANLVMNIDADGQFDIDKFVSAIRSRVALTKNNSR